MIDFTEKFSKLEAEMKGQMKKIPINSAIKVYYGINPNGGYRLCFLSKAEAPYFDSTKLIRVSRTKEKEQVYWLYFDLIDLQAKEAFYALCGSLVSALENIGIKTEETSFTAIKNRFYIWRKLLKKEAMTLSEEISKGLFGELYFLLHRLSPKVGIMNAIDAWSGPDGFTKDFAYNDSWFEIKTVSSSAVTVKISSLSQLASPVDGHLVIIKVDSVGEKFDGHDTGINELVNEILEIITNDETKEIFLDKLIKYGYSVSALENKRYQVVSLNSYLVSSNFPRLTETEIPHCEIAKISYELIVNTLEKYKEN